MIYKETHPKNNRRIIQVEEASGLGLSRKQSTCNKVITKCMRCENQFVQFFYGADDISDMVIGDRLPGGQQTANVQL